MSYDRSRAAWERARGELLEKERQVEARVGAADRYIRESRQAHHEWCSGMLEEVRTAQAALRQERERYLAELEIHRVRVEGAAQQAAQSLEA